MFVLTTSTFDASGSRESYVSWLLSFLGQLVYDFTQCSAVFFLVGGGGCGGGEGGGGS